MNTFFRICVAIYSFISLVLSAVIMISPFGEKKLMAAIFDYMEVNFYQSNKYDVLVFVIGLVFFIISLVILTSGVRGKNNDKYVSTVNEKGEILISSGSIENIALNMSKRFQGVKDVRAKASFKGSDVNLGIRLQVYSDVNIPELCTGIQDRVKDSIESCTDIKVSDVSVTVDGVVQQS